MALNLDETYSLLAKGRATQRAQARKTQEKIKS